MRNFKVYLAYCKVSEKTYVGITKNSVQKRWYHHVWRAQRGSPFHFHNAIRKYGPEAFEVQQLATGLTREEALRLEKLWVLVLQSCDRQYGYNMTSGGDAAYFTEEVLAKMRGRQTFLGKTHSPETKVRMRLVHLGHKASDATRKKFSILRKGKGKVPTCNAVI